MIDSLAKKISVLATVSILLTVLLSGSLYKIFHFQNKSERDLMYLNQVQISLDQLRSQLWSYSQHRDDISLREVELSQQQFANLLSQSQITNKSMYAVEKMNQTLASLLDQYKYGFSTASTQAQNLLQSRYSMLIQTMTEEVARVHQDCLAENRARLNQIVYYAAFGLVVFTLLVCAVAILSIFHFHKGLMSVREGMEDLSKGKLDRTINAHTLDHEFQQLAGSFNEMASSLRQSTVTKVELEEEIEKQTRDLKLKQTKLELLSETDPLTDLLNRRAFDRTLNESIIRAKRTNLSLAILFVDLDNFKQINDKHGHDAGDAVLKEVSRRLKESIRRSDFVGRHGGDEFILCYDLLSSVNAIKSKASELLTTLCQPLEFKGKLLNIQVSIGISYYPNQAQDKDTLIALADNAMYKAKQVDGGACYDQKVIAAVGAKKRNSKVI
ncbi:GGDEF domain-containing protein [Vibrio sonorensis]|uniref:GGDEF domain-containing protein n=1 Tax=Vibrio sonorensis TaxID=1004316 RepID=UPI0008D950F2|nr:GGDEF domain-containing protein [Vibrio sonorensis]